MIPLHVVPLKRELSQSTMRLLNVAHLSREFQRAGAETRAIQEAIARMRSPLMRKTLEGKLRRAWDRYELARAALVEAKAP